MFSGVSDIFFFVGLFGEFVFSDSIFCEMKSEKMGCFGFWLLRGEGKLEVLGLRFMFCMELES